MSQKETTILETEATETQSVVKKSILKVVDVYPPSYTAVEGEDPPVIAKKLIEEFYEDGKLKRRMEHVDDSREEHATFYKMLMAMCEDVDPTGKSLLVVGGGLCQVQNILRRFAWASMDTIEIRQEVCDWNQANRTEVMECFNWTIGDYKDVMSGTWDVIIFDVDYKPTIDLNQHLKPNGKIYYYNPNDVRRPLNGPEQDG